MFSARSDRVKCVDFHPSEPWVLVALYSGVVNIWNYQTQALVKTIEVCDSPGIFVAVLSNITDEISALCKVHCEEELGDYRF